MGIHALIIENDLDSIEVLAHMLRREDVSYTAVSRPTDLSPSDVDAVNVVFLDLDLPGMNGYQVYDVLRHQYHLDVPIVAYTVNTNEKSTTRSLGFNGMLAKPLDPGCFSDQLRRLLNGEALWDEC